MLHSTVTDEYRYRLSTICCWTVGFFNVFIFHIDFLSKNGKLRVTIGKKSTNQNKKEIKKDFKSRLFLKINKPKHVSGSSKDGNTNRTTVADWRSDNSQNFNKIWEIYPVISTFGVLLKDKLKLYLENYDWYYILSSVHSCEVIRLFYPIPIGMLSKEASEIIYIIEPVTFCKHGSKHAIKFED